METDIITYIVIGAVGGLIFIMSCFCLITYCCCCRKKDYPVEELSASDIEQMQSKKERKKKGSTKSQKTTSTNSIRTVELFDLNEKNLEVKSP